MVSSREDGQRLRRRRLTSGSAGANRDAAEAKKPTVDRMGSRPSRDAIAQRAHEIYLRRGGAPGHAMDDWLQAERELSGRRT
jgi:hypothetical protein